MSLSKPANFDQAQSVIPCDVCEAESGEHYCTVCRQTLCDGCEKVHKKVASTKDHEVVPRVQMASAVASTTCSRHSDQTVSLQCGRCQVLVCIKCVTGEHSGHPMIELSKIYEDERAILEKDINEIEQKTIPSLTNAIKGIPPKKEEYRKAIAGIRKDMDDEMKVLIGMLDRIHADRLKKLAEVETAGLTQFDLVQRGLEEQKRSYTDDVAACKAKIASNNQVLFLSFALTSGMKGHIHKCPILKFSSPQIQMVKTENKDISELLTKLKISSTPACTISYKQIVEPKLVSTFKSKSKGLPSICLSESGKAWVGGKESTELKLIDSYGKVLITRHTKYRPSSLSMTSSGDIIFGPRGADSSTVMKLQADGTECPLLDVSPSYSLGVSVTQDDDILISLAGGRVMRCNVEGGNVRQLYDGKKADSALYAIEPPDGSIYISDQANNVLINIDKNGKVLKQISTTKSLGVSKFTPNGLTYDSIGNILTADFNNDRVCIMSPNGDIRELVGKSHGIKEPRWLAADNDNVWIAQNDGHIKVVKYLA